MMSFSLLISTRLGTVKNWRWRPVKRALRFIGVRGDRINEYSESPRGKGGGRCKPGQRFLLRRIKAE